VQLSVNELRAIVREEIKIALAEKAQPKLLFDTAETAVMLNVAESWIGTKARAGEIPHRMLGHYRRFSMGDIEKIVELLAIDTMPMVHSSHDGQAISPGTQGAEVEPIATSQGVRSNGDGGGAVGAGRAVNIGAGGAGDETLARKGKGVD
jgi:hypothetical protein